MAGQSAEGDFGWGVEPTELGGDWFPTDAIKRVAVDVVRLPNGDWRVGDQYSSDIHDDDGAVAYPATSRFMTAPLYGQVGRPEEAA